MLKLISSYITVLVLLSTYASAQYMAENIGKEIRIQEKPDSSRTKNRSHSPAVAMLFSTCIPGLGQAYNKKYWKIPLVYASVGTTIYFYNYNNKLYRDYKRAYINKTDTLKSTIDIYPKNDATWLLEQVKDFRKYRDLNVILGTLFYTLNIVDAYVDAQLINFDVSDNLSMNIAPALNFNTTTLNSYPRNSKPSAGLTLTFTF
jgi:hypothetical protein